MTKGDPVKESNGRMGWEKSWHMSGYPQGNLICDHVMLIGDFL